MEVVNNNINNNSNIRDKIIAIVKTSISFDIGIVIILFCLVISFMPQHIAKYDPIAQNPDNILQAPSIQHLFGTDNYGRDVFSRVVYGTSVDIKVGILATIIPLITGSLIGLAAGYYGGWIDNLLMRILDVFMAFPYLVLVIAIVAILGPSINNLYIAIWLVGWKQYARLVRGEVMVVKNAEYVQAAKVLGFSNKRIIFKHVLQNSMSSAIVYAASDVVMCMLAGASLGFLGLGVQPPTPEWGTIIADGRGFIYSAWWICTFPGLALIFAGTGFSLMGDGISDIMRKRGR